MKSLRLVRPALFVFVLGACRLEGGFGGTEVFVPATARAAGAGGAQFYSTLWITNLGTASANLSIQFLRQGQTNPTPTTKTEILAPGDTQRIDDVVTYLGESGGGALRVVSDQEVFVSSRTYNQPPGTPLWDANAVFFSGIPAAFAIGAGDVSRLQGITNGLLENYRYNFGLVETVGQSVTVNVTIEDGTGLVLGTKQYALGAYEALQVNAFAGFTPAISTTNAILLAQVASGSGKVLLYGTQIAGTSDVPGSNDSAGFEMSFKDSLLSAGVTSLNGLIGPLTIAAGANTTVTQAGSTITINAVSGSGTGLTAVAHDTTLAGSGTASSNLKVAVPLDLINTSTTCVGACGLVQTVSSGSAVVGLSLSTNDADIGVHGSGDQAIGVEGDSIDNSGVQGTSTNRSGVVGTTSGTSDNLAGVFGRDGAGAGHTLFEQLSAGVRGEGQIGVVGITNTNSSSGAGVNGWAYLPATYGVFSNGDLGASGAKAFVEPHPTDPSKEIRYVALEGPEAGTYFRGTAMTVNLRAIIPVPDTFRIVTAEEGLTVQVTPIGEFAQLVVISRDLNQIVVRSSRDVTFDYHVNGIRRAFKDWQVLADGAHFRPTSSTQTMPSWLTEEAKSRLIANGTYNPDGTVNMHTAERLGWAREWSERAVATQAANRE